MPPVHCPGFKANPLLLRVVDGLSVREIPVTFTEPLLQTCALKGTCTTHPPEPQLRPGPGAVQCFITLSEVVGDFEHVAEAVLSELMVVLPKVELADAWFVSLNALEV